MTRLVITPKFKRVYRKFTKGDLATRKRIDDAIEQMQIDPFAPNWDRTNCAVSCPG